MPGEYRYGGLALQYGLREHSLAAPSQELANLQAVRQEVMGQHTFRLFAVPTFTEGAARIFDFTGALDVYRYSDTDEEADFDALQSDWNAVGQDLYNVLGEEAGA